MVKKESHGLFVLYIFFKKIIIMCTAIVDTNRLSLAYLSLLCWMRPHNSQGLKIMNQGPAE